MVTTKEKQNYIDVTREWKESVHPNSHRVRDRNYFETMDGKRYYVDGKNVVLDYSQKEKEVALWLANTFGGEIYMNPRLNYPQGIQTPDYFWNNENWDLKELINVTSKSRAIDNIIKDCQGQCNCFIVDISNCKLKDEIIIQQIKNLFNSTNKLYRRWVEKIIIKKNKRLVKVYIKNEIHPRPTGKDDLTN